MKHVYGMQRADGAVKIGISVDPHTRKITVGREVRQPVDVSFSIPLRSDARKVEVAAHKLLREKHETGEWFLVSVEEAMNAVSQAVRIVDGEEPDITADMPRIPKVNTYSSIYEDGNMEPRNIRFPKAHLAALSQMSKDKGVKEPELIRRALEEYLDKWKAGRSAK